jgi:hypothetical protein
MKNVKIDINLLQKNKYTKALLDELPESTFNMIVTSTKKFGQAKPMLITKENELLSDNEPLEVYKMLGFKEVECVVKDELTNPISQEEFSILEPLSSRQLSAKDIVRLYDRLKEINPSEWGGDRKSKEFQERKNCAHETLKQRFAAALNVSPRTLDNIRASVRKPDKDNNSSDKIPLRLDSLKKELKVTGQQKDLDEYCRDPPAESKAYLAEDDVTVTCKNKLSERIIKEKYLAKEVKVSIMEFMSAPGVALNEVSCKNLKKILDKSSIIRIIPGHMLCIETDQVIYTFPKTVEEI